MTAGINGRNLSFRTLLRRPEAGSFLGLLVVYAIFVLLGGWNFVGVKGFSGWLNIAAEVAPSLCPSAF